MKREDFLHLIRSIFGAQEKEMLCSEFFELLPRYVDLVLAGEDPSKRGWAHWKEPRPPGLPELKLPQVAHHMAQCPECGEAYEALLKVARSAE